MTRIKVLHIITRLDRGGSAENTLLTVLNLDKTRFEVNLISGPSTNPPKALIERVKKEDVNFIEIKQLQRSINIFRDIAALCVIFRLIKQGIMTL